MIVFFMLEEGTFCDSWATHLAVPDSPKGMTVKPIFRALARLPLFRIRDSFLRASTPEHLLRLADEHGYKRLQMADLAHVSTGRQCGSNCWR